MSLTTLYVLVGGMYSVVVTDVIQYSILSVVSICVAVIAITRTTVADIEKVVPNGWKELFFGFLIFKEKGFRERILGLLIMVAGVILILLF